MNKKLTGIIACLVLIAVSIFVTACFDNREYYHQYEKENSISTYTFEEIDDVYTNIRPVDETNYCLDDYFFSNVAQEVMSLAPLVKYVKIGEQLYIIQENYQDCINNSEYIIKVDPLETMETKSDKPERIVSFVDYSYLSKDGRYVYALYQNDYSLKEIKSELSYFEKCLYSYDYEDDDYGHQTQLNERSFADYFVMFELAYPGYYNEENFVIYKDSNNRYRILTSSFENSSDKTYKDDVEYHNLISTTWFSMLCKSQIFTDAVLDEYHYFRKNSLSNENLNKILESCANFLINSEGIDVDEVTKEKESLSKYLNERLTWLDKNIESIKEFSARSAVKEYNNKPY